MVPIWKVRPTGGLRVRMAGFWHPPHDETGHTWHHDSDTLFQLTKYGVSALINDPDYASNMPIYDGVLSDEEIIAVISYIKSTWSEEIRARHTEMENRQ